MSESESTPTPAPANAQWFALHTLSGQEGKVKLYIEKFKKAEELDDSIFEVLLPTEVVSEVKNGKKSTKRASCTLAMSSSTFGFTMRTRNSSTSRGTL